MCHQCHAPVCRSCTTVTPHGSFCSSECSTRNREFKETLQAGGAKAGGGGVALKLFLFLLLAVGTLAGIHLAAVRGFAPARNVDLIGRLLEKAGALRPAEPK
jgi:hypothetical protein